jgi:hypothetical protein
LVVALKETPSMYFDKLNKHVYIIIVWNPVQILLMAQKPEHKETLCNSALGCSRYNSNNGLTL